jgi:hypothetical protein
MLLLTIEKNEERRRKFAIRNWKGRRKEKEICNWELERNEQKLKKQRGRRKLHVS